MNTPSGPLDKDATFSHILRMAELATGRPTPFELVPDPSQCDAIAADLGLPGLRKLRFVGSIAPLGKRDWQMTAQLGASVVQDCVVTLAPVTTRIEEPIERRWLHQMAQPDSAETEVEMPEDDNAEPLRSEIDIAQVMIEALALALPLYPRAQGAQVTTHVFAQPGIKPMTDEDAKPFAGLSALRDKLSGGDKSD